MSLRFCGVSSARLLSCLSVVAAIACGSASDPVDPEPNPPAPLVPASIAVNAGDQQEAEPGRATAIAPAVVVRTANGTAVPNVTVTFTVDSGGGAIVNATAATDASGMASAGAWTLGAAEGPQVLIANTGSLSPVKIRAVARVQTAVVNTSTVTPGGGTITIDRAGSPLNGATILIPGGAVNNATPISISVTSTAGMTLRDGATPVGPALVITTAAGRLEKPAIVTMPVPSHPGKTYMLAMRDPATGSFTILPPLRSSGTSIAAVLHALDASIVSPPSAGLAALFARTSTAAEGGAQLLTIQIPDSIFTKPYDSKFRAQRDNWDFDRMPIAWLPFLRGTSEASPADEVLDPDFGMLATSLWYFETQKSGGPLYGRFRKQADQAKSNVMGIRWAALANRGSPDQNAEVSARYQEWLSSDPADMAAVKFKAIKALFWNSYDRPVPLFLYDSFAEGADAFGLGIATRTLGDNAIEIVVADNKETPYRLELTPQGFKPITVVARDGSTYEVKMAVPQEHRFIVDGDGVANNWSRVLDGTIGDLEGWPRLELHWDSAKLEHSAPIILADTLKQWWECPSCPNLVTTLPGLPATASKPQGFQMGRITAGSMPQWFDDTKIFSAIKWNSDSVTSDLEPSTTGHIIYMPQALIAPGSCPASPPRRYTRRRCGSEVDLPERGGYVGGWLDWQTVRYRRMATTITPDSVHASRDTVITHQVALQSPPSGVRYRWVIRGLTIDSVETTVPQLQRTYADTGKTMVIVKVLQGNERRLIGRDTAVVTIGRSNRMYRITTLTLFQRSAPTGFEGTCSQLIGGVVETMFPGSAVGILHVFPTAFGNTDPNRPTPGVYLQSLSAAQADTVSGPPNRLTSAYPITHRFTGSYDGWRPAGGGFSFNTTTGGFTGSGRPLEAVGPKPNGTMDYSTQIVAVGNGNVLTGNLVVVNFSILSGSLLQTCFTRYDYSATLIP